jgi:hypothetical protein
LPTKRSHCQAFSGPLGCTGLIFAADSRFVILHRRRIRSLAYPFDELRTAHIDIWTGFPGCGRRCAAIRALHLG